ncbi:MAG: LysM peptidoglycan-binding domain-containing protein [Nitrospirae bacterium]|nr:LysM peptidoglycan-binding domain-containing protein [Nitrospirota bacterium]
MKSVLAKQIRLFIIFLITIALISCAKQEQKPDETVPEQPVVTTPETAPAQTEPPVSYFVHTVKWPGETVSIIAGWYTGDIQNWKALADANPDINPSRIHPGMNINVPEDMMKTRDPMPKEFVDSFYPKAVIEKAPPKPTPPPPPPPVEEEPPLFGPKKYPKK